MPSRSETAAGLSTLVILRHGVARHISVTPYPNELEAIRTYLHHGQDPTGLAGRVTELAGLAPVGDVACWTSCHRRRARLPGAIFVDWCYTSDRSRSAA